MRPRSSRSTGVSKESTMRTRIAAVVAMALVSGGLAAAPTAPRQSRPAPELAAILKHVPDDAHLVFVVPSVQRLAAGLSGLGRATGLHEAAEITAASLLQDIADNNAGALDPEGGLALALSAEYEEPVFIATVKDASAWSSTTKPTSLRDGVDVYQLGGERGVALVSGNIAIFARDRAEARRALDATGKFAARWGREISDRASERQAFVLVDVPAWRDVVNARLTILMRSMAMGMAAAGPDTESAMQIWNWVLEQSKQLIGEAQGVLGSVRLDSAGVRLDVRITFRADGAVGKYLAQVKKPQRDVLRGLPAGDGNVIVGFEWEDAPGTEGLNEAMSRALLNMESIRERIGPERLEAVLKRSVELNRKVPGANVVFSILPGGRGMLYWGLYLTDQGPAVQREFRAICEFAPEVMNAWGTFPASIKPVETETIDGAQADVYQFSFGEGSPMQPMMAAVYGAKPTLYMTPHQEGLLYVFGPQEAAREKVKQALKPPAKPLRQDARVKHALQQLSDGPQACLLMDMPALLSGASELVQQIGLPVPPMKLTAPDAPLIGATFYLDPDAIRGELFVPAEPIKAVIRFAENADGDADGAR
jgi:hypothetical protein